MFDTWSIQHFTTGAVIAGFGIFNMWQYVILHSLFELWENTWGIVEWQDLGWVKYQGDSWLNIIGDTLSGAFGFYIVHKLLDGKRAPLKYLIPLIGVGTFITYNHPPPLHNVSPKFLMKDYVGTIAGIGLGIYLVSKVK